MIPEQNIAKFLETFDRNNKIHMRAFEILKESFSSADNLLGLIELVCDSGVNTENLKHLLSSNKEQDKEESASCFDRNVNIDARFKQYESGDNLSNGGFVLSNSSVNLSCNDFEIKKRKVISESSSEIEGIPGLGFSGNSNIKVDLSANYNTKVDNNINYNTKADLNANYNKVDYSTNSSTNSNNKVDYNLKPLPSYTLPAQVSSINIQPPISIDLSNKDTVFYQNILQESKFKSPIDLSRDADPCYLFPVLQCKLCGLRFNSDHSAEFGLHIDDHRRFTNALGEKVVLRREFFSSKSINKIEKLDLTLEGQSEAIIWGKESPCCFICGKIIKKVWDDKIENWVLDEGTRINEKEVAHKKCVY